ncbi:MAG: hypothetical protein JNL74_19740, partial [Fibrobacteres bacterium]|nr:hypothetical protein [Fibrobacterota bacterium]
MKNLIFYLCVLLPVCEALAQGCCGASSPQGTGLHTALHRGEFLIRTGVDYSNAENPSRNSVSSYAAVAYGMAEFVSLSIKSSYSLLSASRFRPAVIVNGVTLLNDTVIEQSNKGLGDGVVGAQFTLIPMNWPRQYELLAAVDLLIPWAEDAKMENNVQLPDNIQTGNGGYAVSIAVGFVKAIPNKLLSLQFTANHKFKFETRKGSIPGDESGTMLSLSVGPVKYFNFFFPFSFKSTQATYSKFDIKEIATAGNRIDL